MAEETERKYLNVRRADLRPRLVALGAVLAEPAHFETNRLYDTPDLGLCATGRLLRLRMRERAGFADALVTVKRRLPDALLGGRPVKRREEIETGVASAPDMERAFLALGYVPVMSYEKVRESWVLCGARADMDELPFADVVELEGPVDALLALEAKLGLGGVPTSAASYHDLHQDWRREHGLAPQTSFYFEQERRARLRADLGLSPEGGLAPLLNEPKRN